MVNELVEYLRGKKINILGFGVEGVSTYKFIRKYLKEQEVWISDLQEDFNLKYDILADDSNIKIVSGEAYLDNLEDYDIIIKSPGIAFNKIDISGFEDKIKSQLELFMEFIDVFTIGITGTKGKSTTSSMIYKVIKEQGKDVLLLGNIGVPLFDNLDLINEDTIVVLELSSHQLEFVKNSPNIAILLNIYEEHLDHYKSMQGYIDAKLNIHRFQKSGDSLIYNCNNEILNKEVKQIKNSAELIAISLEKNEKIEDVTQFLTVIDSNIVDGDGKKIYNVNDDRKLLGKHNLNNIMFVLAVSQILGLDKERTAKSINSFEALPHRMEFVGKYDGVLYYNDSIATIPQSTMATVEALKNVDTLIIGGMDRGVDFTEFIEYLSGSNIANLICLPTTGTYIADRIKNEKMNVYKVEDMREAVTKAKKVTKKDKICLLSPAAASYGVYKNFKEKGEEYKKFVRE